TVASGFASHVEGFQTCDNGLAGVHVMGQNGGPNPAIDLSFSWYLVNGSAKCDTNGVVAKILNNGSACFDSTVTASVYITSAGACDYAEMFETTDSQPIDVGYFVTFTSDGEKIRKANGNDKYILGVTSSRPGILADTEDPACSKYVLDEWNREIYEDVIISAITDTKGNVLVPEHIEKRKKINPEWDPNIRCSSRLEKPEWVAVGLVGKLLVHDDGTCRPASYCKPNSKGIATASDNGYWVMKRTGSNQIMILVR
ncbi:peptidase G2 autoproteolytic cleavage domain-containing protein, partial [Bacillus mycoides]|uniref:peptidase G2 autoproteolytic cleavage domain-containing protein n=1 Tax=Bacillus mycoides TaxID=1405 RepID=UPI002AB1B936